MLSRFDDGSCLCRTVWRAAFSRWLRIAAADCARPATAIRSRTWHDSVLETDNRNLTTKSPAGRSWCLVLAASVDIQIMPRARKPTSSTQRISFCVNTNVIVERNNFSFNAAALAPQSPRAIGFCGSAARPEIAALQSIKSSASESIDAGMVRPTALAAVRLMTSSNLVGCWIGRLAGFSPLST